MGTFLGALEVMLLSCAGAFGGSLIEDIVVDFARQDEALAKIEDMLYDDDDYDYMFNGAYIDKEIEVV